MGLTYNNLGCLSKQQKDFKSALIYLKNALDYESRLEDLSEEDDEEFSLGDAGEIDIAFTNDFRII